MTPDTEAKLVRITVHVSEGTVADLRQFAEQADRPFSREVRRALEDYVERLKEAA